ncbi:GAF domain-containing protein, partial [archaeon]
VATGVGASAVAVTAPALALARAPPAAGPTAMDGSTGCDGSASCTDKCTRRETMDAAADTQRTPALDRQPERPCVRQTVQSMLVVPIRLPNGKLVGVVQVLNKKYNRESAYAGLDDDDFGMSSRTPSASSVPASEQTARPTNTSSKEKWAAAEAFSNALQVVISASNADPNVQSPVLTATSPRVDSIPSLSLLLSSSTYTSNAPTTSSTGGLYNSSTLQLHPVASAVDVTHGMERTPDTQPESQRSADSSGRLVDEGSTSSPRPAAGDADAGDLGKSSTRPVSFTFKSAVTSPSTDDTGDAPAVLQLMRRTGRRVTLADTDSLLVSLKSLHLSEHPSDAAGAPDSGSGATSASSVEETSPAYETLHPAVTPGAVLSPDDVCLALDRFRKRVGASTSCPFTPADAAVAESLSVSVGMCFQRGVLFTSITRARRKAEALLEVVRGTRLESNFDKVLQRVLAAAYHAISADRMSVFLVDEARSELYCTYSKDIQGARLSMRNGLVGCAARTGEVVHVSDAYEDPRFDRSMDTATGYRTKSVLCLPITDNKGRVMAVLQAINKTPNASARMELPASTGSTEDGEPIPAWLNLDISSTGGTSFDSEDREILSACALEIASKLKSRSIEELLLRGEKRVARLAQRRYMSGDVPVTGTPLPGGVRVPGLALPITPAIARTASAALFTATSAGTTAMSSTNGSLLDLLEGPLRGTSGVGPSDASIPSSTSALSPAFGTHEGVAYGLADGCALPVGAAYASTYLPTMTDGFCDDDDDDAEEAVRPSLLDGSDESARSCLRPEDAVMALVSNTDTLENTRLTNGTGSLESVRHAHGLAPVATSTLVVPVPTTAASPAAGGNTFSFVGRPTRTYSGTSSVSAASAEPDSRGSSAGLVSSRRMPAAPPPYAPSHTSPTLPLRSGMTRAHSTSDVSDMDDVEGIADGGKIVE